MADLSFLGADHGLRTTPQNLIAVDPKTLATSRPGVFAGGDIAFGPRIVISAVADGRRAARAIDTPADRPRRRAAAPPAAGVLDLRLRSSVRARRLRDPTARAARGDPRRAPDPGRRGGAGARRGRGARRGEPLPALLGQHGVRFVAHERQRVHPVRRLRRRLPRAVHRPRVAATRLGRSRRRAAPAPRRIAVPRRGAPGAALLKDETACIRCGLCARRCPVGLITMQALYREDEAALCRLADSAL